MFAALFVIVLVLSVGLLAYLKRGNRRFFPLQTVMKRSECENGRSSASGEVSFNDQHRHSRDELLHYVPEEHRYVFRDTLLTSVYDAVESFFPAFDAATRSAAVAAMEGRAPEYVRERWAADFQLARQTGGFLHLQFDRMLHRREPAYTFHFAYTGSFFRNSRPVSVCREVNQFAVFLPSLAGLKPYRSLWRIFDDGARVTGVVDLLLEGVGGHYVFCDWTYNSNMGREVDGSFELYAPSAAVCGLAPLGAVADTPFLRAAVRMNVLRVILKRHYDISVDDLRLVVFHAQNVSAHVLTVPILEREAEAVLAALAKFHV